MWKLHKNARKKGIVGSSIANFHDGLDAGNGEFPARISASIRSTKALGRRGSRKPPASFALRRGTATTSSSPLNSSSGAPRRRRSAVFSSAANRTQSNWNTVAQEIETVVFGDSDEEEKEDEGPSRQARRNALTNSTTRSNRSRSNFGMRLGRWRRKSPTISRTVSRPSIPMTHMTYNLFDDLQVVTSSTTSSFSSSRSTQRSSIVIYGQKYCNSSESLFKPISIVLSATFVTLLGVRIVTNLLTSEVGMVIEMILVGRFLHEVVNRPMQLVQALHSSPVLYWACFGAVFFSLRALRHHRIHQLFPLFSWLPTTSKTITSSFEWVGIGNTITVLVENDRSSDDESTYNDLIMLWGLIHGLFCGLQVGCVWLIIFGDVSNPSRLTQSFHRRIWRPLRLYHQRTIIQIQNWRLLATSSSNPFATAMPDGLSLFEQQNGIHKHRCAICLESFVFMKEEEQVDGDPNDQHVDEAVENPRVQCQLLPCLHCFHKDCARQWLTIRHTCPICRVPVRGMQSCD